MIIVTRGLLIDLGELKDFYDIISEFILFCTYFYFPKVFLIFYLNFYYKPYSCNKDFKIFIYFSYDSIFYFLNVEDGYYFY
jgi:hypothetical protein